MPDKTPVFVITGFLGAGKTTLLNRLVRDPGLADTAVVINEFGEIGLDHLLVESAVDGVVLMQSGCLCCTIRGDLVDTLNDLFGRREKGTLPPFSRVVVETTGLADPVPILQTLLGGAGISDRFRAAGVVTVVDALHGAAQLGDAPEPARQAAVADRIVLSKVDVADRAAIGSLTGKLRALNPSAPIHEVTDGRIEPGLLFGDAMFDPDARNPDVRAWLGAPDVEGSAPDDHGHDVNRHGADIRTFCLTHDAPVEWSCLSAWLRSIVSLRGEDILRLKGIVNVAGIDGPVAVHGIRHTLHPPVALARWQDQDRRTRLVFICRNLDAGDLAAALDAALRSGTATVAAQ